MTIKAVLMTERCPKCQAPVITRTRGIPSYGTCANGHTFECGKESIAPPRSKFTTTYFPET